MEPPRDPAELPIESLPKSEKPAEGQWTKPISFIALAAFGLLCLVFVFKWVLGSSHETGLVRVSGIVTMGRKPLAGADVTFHPAGKEGKTAFSKTDRLGHFRMKTAGLGDGVWPGEYRVTVTLFRFDQKPMSAQETKEYIGREGKAPPMPNTTNIVPEIYANSQTSKLTATIGRRPGRPLRFDIP